jgi:hypothetical protein
VVGNRNPRDVGGKCNASRAKGKGKWVGAVSTQLSALGAHAIATFALVSAHFAVNKELNAKVAKHAKALKLKAES